MKEKRKSHKLLSLLLCCAVLIGMMPMTAGTAFAADIETHPEKVNFLDNSVHRLCYYTDKWDAYGSREYKKVSTDKITGNTDDEKWKSFTTEYAKKGVVGWIYYIQETGTLYIKGTIPSIAFQSKADAENVLKVIVAGDTTIERSIYGYVGNMGSVAPGLKKMTIEFRNGSTLTLSKNKTDKKKAILDITKTDGNKVRSYGDLELTGNGTLKIAPTDYTPNVMFGIRANNISVLDNVSLDIKMGSRYDLMNPVSAAAITCDGKLNIDTTGTVKIDVSEKIDPSARDERGYFKVFSNVTNTTFNLTYAKSVTLKSREKKDTFVAYSENVIGGENWYSTIMTALRNNGWTVTETAADASPYTVTMTRTGLNNAILNIGGKKIESTGAVTKGELQADGNTQALSIEVKSPRWLSAMYLSRVDYTYTAAVYENGVKLFDTDKFVLNNFGATDGPSTVTLELADSVNFKPTAGKSYIVTFSITPKVYGGGKLESAAISGNWLLTAVEKQDVAIPALKLKMLTPLVDGRTTGPSIDPVNEEHYSGGTNARWTESGTAIGESKPVVGGKTYSTIRTLIADEGYKFTNATVVSFDGPGTVTKKEVLDGGKKLAVTVTSDAVFTVDFLNENNSQAIAQQNFSKDEKLVLPDQSSETPDGKIFAGWKSGETTYQPGDEITVTESLTFNETWKDRENYGLRVFPSSQIYEVRQKQMDTSAKRSFTLYNTGNSDLGKITVSVDTTKTPRWNEYKEYLYLNGIKQDSVVLDDVNQELHFELKRPTESTGAPKDFIDATVWLKITSENGSITKTAQVKIKVTPGPYVVSCTLVQPNAEGASSPYKLIEGSETYSVAFVPSSIDPDDIPAGTEVGMVAPVIPGYDFVKWVDFSATAGSGVTFSNDTSATTSFIMPNRDIGRFDAGIFAVYTPSTAPAHVHNYGDCTMLDDTCHYQTCSGTTGTCNEPMKVQEHTWGAWTAVTDTDTHERTCTATGCTAKQTANHNWVIGSQTDATFDAAGKTVYKCNDDCGVANKQEAIAKLNKITNVALTVTAPVYGATPEWPTTTNAEYDVANTVWEPAVSGTFAQNTVYTVKVELEANDSNRFTNETAFTINGQTATVVGTAPTAAGTETVTLTYQFPKTGSGSAGGSSKPTVQKPEITIIGSGKADLGADGRTATIAADAGNELVSITLNGKEVAKTDKLTSLKTGDKVVITFRKTADDSAAITKSIASKVSKMQLIARSSKTAKKNIKVVLKTDAKTTALIKDIQELGYTVKYKFYRSTKKSASYKAMLTKDETKYLNTIGKKGTMYYYKARLMVYDKSGKLVTYSKLTQCKYANRLWTK